MTLLDLGILLFVVGVLLFMGIWYFKEEMELAKHQPTPKQNKHPREKPVCTD
ncbi:hypothetical protein [Melghirimyces algeriensis]|uniref:Uncharacterized protein n=1 Tax=Melghirimyces algeriensis TaxID=910412 RepID=A0A521E2B9_9BACL|nr:hypothetical protein [Melghirimyces algeriensis]SMO78042.1 hypothetical protein SAMN06264849_107148 [Melghirimyces algeriensis]